MPRTRGELPPRRTRALVIQPECLEDLQHWARNDRRTISRILRLMEEVLRNPFTGTGKPEPLKALGPNVWSRRITQADRLVYVVHDHHVDFLQARYHY